SILCRRSLHLLCCHPALTSFPTRRSSDLYVRFKQNAVFFEGLRGEPSFACQIRECEYHTLLFLPPRQQWPNPAHHRRKPAAHTRSEEHTSELQSRENLVCRLLRDKKKHR